MQIRTYIGIASLAFLVLGPALAHFRIVPPMVGLSLFMLAALLGLVTSCWGIISAMKQGSLATYLPSVMGLPAIALVMVGALSARGHPRINDISTDLTEPPKLSRAEAYPESFKKIVAKHYADLKPLNLTEAPAAAFDRAVTLAKSRADWSVDRVDKEALVFEGKAETKLFRFVDDFVVRVRKSKDGSGAVVDMRSRSRDGKGDLGKNAARIRGFLADLKGK